MTFILLAMIFLHIVDDYYLQGWLASAKQKTWWEENAPDKMYSRDYIAALLMHAMSWSFMIMLPIATAFNFDVPPMFAIIWLANVVIHATVDNLKANCHTINLIQDQMIHMLQIVLTLWVFVCTI